MRICKYILIFIVILSLSKNKNCNAQTFADKTYYLVDSLDLDDLTESDKQLVDSCLKVYHKAKHDTNKINAINTIVEETWNFNVWPKYNLWVYENVKDKLKQQQHETITQLYKKYLADAINNIGFAYMKKSEIAKALKSYQQALKIREEIEDKEGISASLVNISGVYYRQAYISDALEYSHKALKMQEELGDLEGMATSLNNIGFIYDGQYDLKNALKYYHKSLKIRENIKDVYGIANSLGNIGAVYDYQGDIIKALEYYQKSLVLRKQIEDNDGVSNMMIKMGGIYSKKAESLGILQKEKDSLLLMAIDCYRTSLNLSEKFENKEAITFALSNIGTAMLEMGNTREAQVYADRSLEVAQEIGFPGSIKRAASLLSEIYEKQNKGMQALEMYKLYIIMRDSVFNKKTQKASAQQQAKYEYEKQRVIDDAEHDKLLAVEQEEKEKQQILTTAIGGGLGLVLVFLFFVFNRLRITKKQKKQIENQKLEVESQKKVVEDAHHELEEKNQEIMDSITYAKRIQSAILPPAKVVKEYLQESFILYKPKDIVAGDFYWMESVKKERHSALDAESPKNKNAANLSEIAGQSFEAFASAKHAQDDIRNEENLVLFAAADCTGHGVPGAMVSVVCNNALNRSVREHGLTDPGEILNKTREIVIQEFEKSDEDVQDGMDIALCSLQGSTLKYAGAHNPLWIIRKGEIIETKADKQPIGNFDHPTPYTTHIFDLQKGDSIYIFSDGYVDQFGGEKGKKFKAKEFRALLLSVQDQSLEDQKTIIDTTFETWKGNLEQIDDVCVIGVKI